MADRRVKKEIFTLAGKLSFMRMVLRPSDRESGEKLFSGFGLKSVIPLDIFLGIDGLPCKMSVDMMLKCAFWAQNQCSYQLAEEAMREVFGYTVNDDTIRHVTNFIGKLVFDEDCRLAEEAWRILESGKMKYPCNKNGVLYLEFDGAALNTRIRDADGSTWRENKLGIVFSSDKIYYWKDRDGKQHHQVREREYISYIGSVSEFKKHCLACALRNGYGKYRQTVILSDGAPWIANMALEVFPDAQHILDLFHLKENVYDFAKAKFRQDASAYVPWSERICEQLEGGQWEDVLAGLDPEERYENAVNLYHYICSNKDHIDYPRYKANGWFVGSGAIESGNKVVLQKRMKQAGMRWNPKTAQHLITLCSKKESGRWEKDVETYIRKILSPGTELRNKILYSFRNWGCCAS